MSAPDPTSTDSSSGSAESAGEVWCIVVAGGSGTRYGKFKQFEPLAGSRVLDRSVQTAANCCDGVVVVLPAEFVVEERQHFGTDVVVAAGGASRAESVRAGLAATPSVADYVLVHDGARPLATASLYQRVITALKGGADAVVPAVAVRDTLRLVDGGTVDRDSLRAVQTPQGFSAEVLRVAHADGGEATDDAGLVERLGHHVTVVAGEQTNLKVTEPADLAIAEAILAMGEVR